MNISFNKKIRKEDTIKSQIDQFKLKIDEKNRYLTNFDIFQDDNIFMFYVDNNEIGGTYKDLKLIDIECYNSASIDKDLKDLIDPKLSICEQLICFNDYFLELDEENDSEDEKKKRNYQCQHNY